MARTESADWSGSLLGLASLTLLTTLAVAGPGLWVSGAAERSGGYEYRGALQALTGVGALGFGVLGLVSQTRRLGILAAAGYALVTLAALVLGRLSPWLSLPLATCYGALRVCVWALWFECLATLGRHGVSLMLVLSGVLQAALLVLAGLGLTQLAAAANPRLLFALVLFETLVVASCVVLFPDAPPLARNEPDGAQAFAMGTFVVRVALSLGLGVLDATRSLAAITGWQGPLGALAVNLTASSLFAWLRAKRPATRASTAAAWFIAACAIASPLFFLEARLGHDQSSPSLAFPIGVGSGAGGVASLVLLAALGLHTRPRYLPLVLASVFAVEKLVSRAARALIGALPKESSEQGLVMLGAAVMIAVCYFATRRLSTEERTPAPRL